MVPIPCSTLQAPPPVPHALARLVPNHLRRTNLAHGLACCGELPDLLKGGIGTGRKGALEGGGAGQQFAPAFPASPASRKTLRPLPCAVKRLDQVKKKLRPV